MQPFNTVKFKKKRADYYPTRVALDGVRGK